VDKQILGFLNLNKPGGMTSHDAVNRVRRLTRIKHTGHGGTLDPMAVGVLPVAVGSACRLLRYLSGGKAYKAEILLGRRTTTDDTEGETMEGSEPVEIPSAESVKQALQRFVGDIDQVPPMYSAIHHEGERLYALARKGAVIEAIPARPVHIGSIEFISYVVHEDRREATATVRIACGSGTYIRSIARDLGDALGCGACLSGLVREQSGPFFLSDSIELKQLEEASATGDWQHHLIAPEIALSEMRHIEVDEALGKRISVGQKINVAHLPAGFPPYAGAPAELRMLVTAGARLLSVCRFEDDILRSEVVINRATETV
jgi:tRNA pseudouridine55 synthase